MNFLGVSLKDFKKNCSKVPRILRGFYDKVNKLKAQYFFPF